MKFYHLLFPRWLMGASVLLSLVAMGATAQRTENELRILDLEQYVVKAEDEPGNFLLNMDEIGLTQPVDLAGLLSNEATLAVGGGASVAQKIYVRGFEDTMLNVTIDGAQQAGELYHHQGRVQIEPEFIKTIELEAGAGAATSGAGALTGSLRIENKSAFDMLSEDEDYGAFVKGTYGLNGEDRYKAVLSGYSRLGSNIGAIAVFAYEDAGDYEDGNGDEVAPTAATHERGYVKINGDHNYHKWSVSYENLHDFGTYYERPNMIGFSSGFILSDHDLNRDTLSFNYDYDSLSEWVDVGVTLYATSNDFENVRNTTGLIYGKGDFSSLGFDLRNTAEWENNAITFGVDYRKDEVESAQNATPPPYWGTSEQNASVLGLYAQDNWKVSDALTVSAGVRFDSYKHDVDAGPGAGAENSDSGFSPNISLNWEVVEGFTLRGSYSFAFRGITIREAFFSALYTHQGDLDAEEADNVEIGFAYEKNGFFLRASAYEQTIDNYINSVYLGGELWGVWDNVGKAEVEGYEAEMGQEWDQLTLSASVWNADNSFNGAPLTDGDMGLGTNIGRTWSFKTDYQFPEAGVNVGVRSRYVESKENTIAENAPDKAAYFTTDLHAVWRLLEDESLTLGLTINNVFDRFYFDHATYGYSARTGGNIGYAAKGREIVLSTSWRF